MKKTKSKKTKTAPKEFKTVNDILSMSNKMFDKLTEPELRKVTTKLVSAANKRLKRMEQKGVKSPAYEEVMTSGGKFSIKGKTEQQVRNEFIRIKKFMQSETGTIKGATKYEKEIIKRLEKGGVTGVNSSNVWDIIKTIHDAKQDLPQLNNIPPSKDKTVMALYRKYRAGKISFDELNDSVNKYIETKYLEKQDMYQDVSTAEFFEIE